MELLFPGINKEVSFKNLYYLVYVYENNTLRYKGFDENILLWNVAKREVVIRDHENANFNIGSIPNLQSGSPFGMNTWEINSNGNTEMIDLKLSEVRLRHINIQFLKKILNEVIIVSSELYNRAGVLNCHIAVQRERAIHLP